MRARGIVMLVAALALALCGLAQGAAAAPAQQGFRRAPLRTGGMPAAKAAPAAARKTAAKPQPAAESPWRRTPYVGALVAETGSGRILFADHADQPARMASVSKLMTLLLVLEDVEAGKYGFDAEVRPSAVVFRSEPSWMGLKPGEPVKLEHLLCGLMVRSANDAALALAEWSGTCGKGGNGSPTNAVRRFVARMNARAAELGMANTVYYNPNGLPPNKKFDTANFNVTTCRDQLKLAMEMVKRKDVFRFTSLKTWTMPNGQNAVNHNNVMVKDKLKIINPDGTEAVDGLKTGYIDAGGSSVVLTGSRRGRRAIVVVLGSATAKLRDDSAKQLMEDALGSL